MIFVPYKIESLQNFRGCDSLKRIYKSMKHIAIVTIESFNFGNRLQNFALQQTLRSLGYSIKTLHRIKHSNGIKDKMKHALQYILQTKGSKFRKFDSNIEYSSVIIGGDDYPQDLSEQFDYFIAGSDQVWNPHYNFVGISDLLAFAKPEQRISYAASFGVNMIPVEKKDVYADNLSQFKALSVREKRGAEIIKELTGRDAQVVLDPTMLLTSEQWSKVERKSKFTPKKKYALVYSLGEKSRDFMNSINYYRKELDIFDIRSVLNNGREIPVGPAEFLYLIHHAELILTDSFHASVFSILFHKRFITFKRSGIDMSSRIVSLANTIGAEDKLDSGNNLDCSVGLDYVMVDQLIEGERKKSIDFLKKALED